MMKNGEGGLSVFLGLTGTKEELGLKADNYWIFTENNLDELCVFLHRVSVACRSLHLSSGHFYIVCITNSHKMNV